MKSKSVMFLLWLFTGLIGGHRFYVGKTGSGILYACTCGLFFVGWALDFFRLGSMVNDYNMRYAIMHGGGINSNNNNNANNNQNNIVINMAPPAAAPAAAAPAAVAPAAAAAPAVPEPAQI